VSFAEPRALWLLAAPALALLAVLLRHRRRLGQQRRLASPGVWDRVMGGAPATGLVRMGAWCVAAALLVLALARPQWGELPVTEEVRARDLAVAVDVSDSMLSPDVAPSRLGAALELLRRALPGLEGNRVGVVVFAGEAYPLVPLTRDLSAVAGFLDGVQPRMVALAGSNLERAVDAAVDLLPSEGEGRVVVLMTDGENLQGQVAEAADRLRKAGVGMLGVTVGTGSGGPIPLPSEDGSVHYKRDRDGQPVVTRAHPETLAGLAGAVDGEVLELDGDRTVRDLIAAVDRLRTRQQESARTVRRVERFPVFLAAAVAALLVGFLSSPWRRLAPAAVLVLAFTPAHPASAQTRSPAPAKVAQTSAQPIPTQDVSWWQRLLPGGSRRLARSGLGEWRRGRTDRAARDFAGAASLTPSNPERLYDLGTALAAQGKVEVAAPLLRQAQEQGVPSAAYNGGTAALVQGQGEEAVDLLRRALLADGDAPDVKRNYELALRLLKQQQQEQQQQDKEQQKQQQQQPQQQPTPSPGAQGAQGAQAQPTPSMDASLFAALERAEARAREKMRSPTPRAQTVEKDW